MSKRTGSNPIIEIVKIVIVLIILVGLCASMLLAISISSARAVTFGSPLPTPHPPCPPEPPKTAEQCDAEFAKLPACNYDACPLGCVSSIYCVECEGLNCWVNPVPWHTNTLGIPIPAGPYLRTYRVFLPIITR